MYHMFFGLKAKKNNHFIEIILTLFFGLIHGFGFSNYFKSILPGDNEAKLFPLIEFALGIEGAQIIVILVVLILASTLQNWIKVPKKNWILVVSSIIIGILIPMLLERI